MENTKLTRLFYVVFFNVLIPILVWLLIWTFGDTNFFFNAYRSKYIYIAMPILIIIYNVIGITLSQILPCKDNGIIIINQEFNNEKLIKTLIITAEILVSLFILGSVYKLISH